MRYVTGVVYSNDAVAALRREAAFVGVTLLPGGRRHRRQGAGEPAGLAVGRRRADDERFFARRRSTHKLLGTAPTTDDVGTQQGYCASSAMAARRCKGGDLSGRRDADGQVRGQRRDDLHLVLHATRARHLEARGSLPSGRHSTNTRRFPRVLVASGVL